MALDSICSTTDDLSAVRTSAGVLAVTQDSGGAVATCVLHITCSPQLESVITHHRGFRGHGDITICRSTVRGGGGGDGGPAQVQAGQGGLRLAAARLLPRLHGRLAAPGHQVSCDWWRRVT